MNIGRRPSLAAALAFFALAGCATVSTSWKERYPQAPRADVVDDYHGVKVADPYRPLEDADSAQTRAWVEAQNRLTAEFLRGPLREKIEARLTELWNFPRWSLPVEKAGRYYFTRNDGLQNQPVLYYQDGLRAEPRSLLDPNLLSADGTVSLSGYFPSEDGKLLAYLISESGSDWQKVKIRRVESGEDFPEELQRCKFTSIAWAPDGSGFFYNRYPDKGAAPPGEENMHNRLYWHRLGTPQSEDRLIYERPDDKQLALSPLLSEDGRYLLLYIWRGTEPENRIYYRELGKGKEGDFVRLLDRADARYDFMGNVGSLFYFSTNLDAPRGRVIAIDTARPEREYWRQIIAQSDEVIERAAMIGGRLALVYLRDAQSRLRLYNLDGRLEKEVPLPGPGSIFGISGREQGREMFFSFTSFLTPPTVLRYDFSSGEAAVFFGPQVDFEAAAFLTEQVFFVSRDGTRVPMFITRKKDFRHDGKSPALLYGYGGFNVSITPHFSVSRLLWLEAGGIYAVANIRGGNEYGEEWHRAGILEKKQNVFDDFMAAAEWLVAEGYTAKERLAIIGGSNGGLLTAACLVQRPELFGAVISQVPVIDMLRYHKFSVGHFWVSDYGNAEKDREHFAFLYAYSPLHNIRSGVVHPPTLITTADTDDRVVPMHGKKFAAALQAADAGRNPILLRVETRAGHGAGKPTAKAIEEAADILAFLFKAFGMKL